MLLDNWLELLPVAVPGLLALSGVIYSEYRKRKNSREEADQTQRLRQEPTYSDIVTEARNLRADLVKQEDRYEKLLKRVEALENEKEVMERAAQSILYASYAQWPQDYPAPLFDRDDLETIPHLVHPRWRYNYRPA